MNFVRRVLMALIRAYQRTLSPLLGDCCRFEPSCSRYCQACVEHHGALRGGALGLWRVLRCNPLFAGGFDPPPLPAHVDPKLYEPNWQRVSDWVNRASPSTTPADVVRAGSATPSNSAPGRSPTISSPSGSSPSGSSPSGSSPSGSSPAEAALG